MAKAGKKYRAAASKITLDKLYPLDEACKLVKDATFVKFDSTVDLAINLGVDPRQADQNVRGATPLPHGLGKTIRIIVFAKGENLAKANVPGVVKSGGDELAAEIIGGWMEFDAVIATPDMMGVVGKLGKVLGPRGLMPNPKLGTVTFDVTKAVNELNAGRTEYRVDKSGIVHCPVGKISFGPEKLADNIKAVIDALVKAKPSTSKGTYLMKIAVSSTMSPSVKIDPSPYRL